MCIFWAWIRKSFTTEKAENSISIETELNWKNWLLVWFHIMYEKISIISVEIGGLLKCMNVNVVYYYINIFICFQSCPIDNVYIVYCICICIPMNYLKDFYFIFMLILCFSMFRNVFEGKRKYFSQSNFTWYMIIKYVSTDNSSQNETWYEKFYWHRNFMSYIVLPLRVCFKINACDNIIFLGQI